MQIENGIFHVFNVRHTFSLPCDSVAVSFGFGNLTELLETFEAFFCLFLLHPKISIANRCGWMLSLIHSSLSYRLLRPAAHFCQKLTWIGSSIVPINLLSERTWKREKFIYISAIFSWFSFFMFSCSWSNFLTFFRPKRKIYFRIHWIPAKFFYIDFHPIYFPIYLKSHKNVIL